MFNGEYYLAQGDITEHGLTNCRSDQHSSMCQIPQSLPWIASKSGSLATTCNHTGSQCRENCALDWLLIKSLLVADEELVSLYSELGSRLALALRSPWLGTSTRCLLPLVPQPPATQRSSLAQKSKVVAWRLHPWCWLGSHECVLKLINMS